MSLHPSNKLAEVTPSEDHFQALSNTPNRLEMQPKPTSELPKPKPGRPPKRSRPIHHDVPPSKKSKPHAGVDTPPAKRRRRRGRMRFTPKPRKPRQGPPPQPPNRSPRLEDVIVDFYNEDTDDLDIVDFFATYEKIIADVREENLIAIAQIQSSAVNVDYEEEFKCQRMEMPVTEEFEFEGKHECDAKNTEKHVKEDYDVDDKENLTFLIEEHVTSLTTLKDEQALVKSEDDHETPRLAVVKIEGTVREAACEDAKLEDVLKAHCLSLVQAEAMSIETMCRDESGNEGLEQQDLLEDSVQRQIRGEVLEHEIRSVQRTWLSKFKKLLW